VLSGFAKTVSRYLCLALAASLILLAFQSDPSLTQGQTTTLSAPQTALLLTQQTRFSALRPQKPDHPDGYPMDVHPAVASADFTPHYAKGARFSFAISSIPAPRNVGWQARAPPFPIMPVAV
jgi:hypothetical protein